MQTVFGHIIQKRLSQEAENVATEALSFILGSSESARNGMTKLLRGIIPQLPRLWFRTQLSDGTSRPDLWGNDDSGHPHVFIENKFWAGLTENQPVSYLSALAKQPNSSALLIVAPKARARTLERELFRKMEQANITANTVTPSAGVLQQYHTSLGPVLALTSWELLFAFLEMETTADAAARSDLAQLRALCEAVDSEAFAPIPAENLSDQTTPGFILQLASLVQDTAASAVSAGILNCKRLNPQADFKRMGRYARLGREKQCGIWLGIHFDLWKRHGGTPLWVVFSANFGRPDEVIPLLEPWAAKAGVVAFRERDDLVVALDLPSGEDKETVIASLLERLRQMGDIVSILKPQKSPGLPPGETEGS